MDDNIEYCCECGKELSEDERNEAGGELYCDECFEDFEQCDGCEEHFRSGDFEYWGESRLCPDCLEEECPSCDEEENEQETQEVYDEMLEEYVGKMTTYDDKELLSFTWYSDYDKVIASLLQRLS